MTFLVVANIDTNRSIGHSGLEADLGCIAASAQFGLWLATRAAVASTGRPNTLIFSKRWSVLNEVSSQGLLFSRTACRYLGSLSAMHASPVGSGWQRGESMRSIGRVFDRQSSSVFSVISPTGGIRPPDRRRGKSALSLSEREEISRGLNTKNRFDLLRVSCDVRLRRSAGSFGAMVAL